MVGINSISLAARYRVAASSSTLRRGLEKVSAARGHNCAPPFALSPAWEHEFLVPSMTFNTANAFDIISRLDRNDTLDDVPQNKKQKAATGLLLDKLHKQVFAGPPACRASRVFGPPLMKLVSRASRPGLLVLCIAQRFHSAEHDHTCRIGCLDEPDSLTHYNECPRLYNISLSGDMLRYCHRDFFYMT